MGEMLSTSAGALFAAATLPGFVLSGLYLLYILAVAILRPERAPPFRRDSGDSRSVLLLMWRGLFPMTFLMVIVLGSIFAGWATPTEASGVGARGALLLAFANGRLNMKTLREVMTSAALTNAMVFFIIFGATLFSYVFRALGGDDVVSELLKAMGLTTGWEVMMFVMALTFFMGFFFDWIEICLIVLPIFAPIIAKLDFGTFLQGKDVILAWFAILMAVNMQTAFLTPPFGFALFYMKGTVPPSVTMIDIYKGITPFVLVQVTALALCMAFPEVVLYLPKRFGFLE